MEDFDIINMNNNDESEPLKIDGIESSGAEISHSPLNLGNSSGSAKPEVATGQAKSLKPMNDPIRTPAATGTGELASWPDRITGMKTFFTKLHAGAIDFLEGQICDWLKNNPGITVKKTNVITGDVVGKKIEPNIIIVVWY